MSFLSGIVGGFIQSNAAKKATKAQVAAAGQQQQLAEEGNEFAQNVFAPYSELGADARNVFAYEMGLLDQAPVIGGSERVTVTDLDGNLVREFESLQDAEDFLSFERDSYSSAQQAAHNTAHQIIPKDYGREGPNSFVEQAIRNRAASQEELAGPNPFSFSINQEKIGGSEYGGYELTPDYIFARDEGLKGIERSAAARGGLNSGATQKALIRFSEGVASQGRNDYLNRLAGLQNLGFTADSNAVTARNNFTNQASNALANIGNAQAAGAVAQGNALSGAISSGFGLIDSLSGGTGGLLNAFGGGGKSSFSLAKAF